MEKLHGKIANGQGVSCEGTIVIAQGILVGGGECVEMGAINGTKGVFKEWEQLGVIKDVFRYGVTNFRESDEVSV